jgi:SAM-dependent methyltransferase
MLLDCSHAPCLSSFASMKENLLYTDWAVLYDAIYHSKNYREEASRVRELLGKNGIKDGSRVLEAACGTGSYLVHLDQWYEVAGFDLNEGILDVARRKLPDANLFEADMADFDVEKPFDAVLCLFSSIGYVYPKEQLERAAECFAAALKPGGVLMIEQFVEAKDFVPGLMTLQTYDGEDLKCARACITKNEGEYAVLDFNWLVMRRDLSEVEHVVERHKLWGFSADLLKTILEGAGFSVSIEADGLIPKRPLVVAKRIPA